MDPHPIKPTYHVRGQASGRHPIPEMLGERDVPEGVVAKTWEISDYTETTGRITNGEYADRTLRDLVVEFTNELVGEGRSGPHSPLLERFIDASKMLPVHLHPDDETNLAACYVPGLERDVVAPLREIGYRRGGADPGGGRRSRSSTGRAAADYLSATGVAVADRRGLARDGHSRDFAGLRIHVLHPEVRLDAAGQ